MTPRLIAAPRDTLPRRPRPPALRRVRGVVFVIALAMPLVAGTTFARGGGGGGHGGGGHGGGHSGGGHTGGGGHGGALYGGRYGGHLYVGSVGVWAGSAHWGAHFWIWNGASWVEKSGRYWVSPQYPGWLWIAPPPVWDGSQWEGQDGYWTTADIPQDEPQPPVTAEPDEVPPLSDE